LKSTKDFSFGRKKGQDRTAPCLWRSGGCGTPQGGRGEKVNRGDLKTK